jgi:hypothetical protein
MQNNTAQLAKIREYEADVQRLRTNLKKAEAAISAIANRDELLTGGITVRNEGCI